MRDETLQRSRRRSGRTDPGRRLGVAARLTPIALVLALVSVACESQDEYRLGVGADVFDRKCGGCHGSSRGEGPHFVEDYGGKAPDLRLLAQSYGSPLPRDELAQFIDGRLDVVAHGPREMPVWGEELYDRLPENETAEQMRAGTIDLILDYLETIQLDEGEGNAPEPGEADTA